MNLTEAYSWMHSIVITSNGQVYTFGQNTFGQLGLNDTNSRAEPTLAPLTNIVRAAVGLLHSLFVTSSGQVYSCGLNGSGQLGLNDTNSRYSPTLITSISNVIQVAGGRAISLFLDRNNILYTCGHPGNSYTPGNGLGISLFVPTLYSNTLFFSSISASTTHSLILTTTGQVYSCGLTIVRIISLNLVWRIMFRKC